MKHRPNILVCDMAHMVTAQGNRFQDNFVSPFEGRVAASTVENSENAKAGNLIISFPFLEDNLPADQHIVDLDSHPVTCSNVRLALFDIFHLGNTNNDNEVLHRTGSMKELKSTLNNQAAEQLHCSFNIDRHFETR